MVKDHSDSEKETWSCHMGYSFWLAARLLLYAPSHRQDNTYHGLYYTSCGTLASTRNSLMGPPWRIDPTTYHTMSERFYHRATYHGRCYTSRGALAGTRNNSKGSPWRIDPTTHHTMNEHSNHRATSHSKQQTYIWVGIWPGKVVEASKVKRVCVWVCVCVCVCGGGGLSHLRVCWEPAR